LRAVDDVAGQAQIASAGTLAGRFAHLRVAIVHHWFIRRAGGERFVEHLARLFPQADLFALTARPEALAPELAGRRLTTSFLQHVPGARRWHRLFMPLFPLAVEQFDLGGYDLVLSSDSGPVKGVVTGTGTCHICYCHSPMRYLWEMYPEYRKAAPGGPLGRAAFALAAHYTRQWDLAGASRPDFFATNSQTSARRIRKFYRRDAAVIYGPIETARFRGEAPRDDFYLVVSRLVGYKRVDLAVDACNRLGRKLVIIGSGEEAARLRRMAGPTVRLLGACTDEVVREHYSRCRALLFPGEEDQGVTPVEAQASGAPVVAYGRGGALETVNGWWPGQPWDLGATGVFFGEQSAEALASAVLQFESREGEFSPGALRAQAERFDVNAFYQQMSDFVSACLRQWGEMNGDPALDRGRAAPAATGRT
jgi:glycosyltransferase involved in cell wall biosynthesis